MYRVLGYFTDRLDNHHPYNVGDIFPREGLEVSEDRIKELSSRNNKRGVKLIEEVLEKNIPEKSSETPKEEPLKEKASVNPPKKTRGKKSAKKA